MSSHQLSSYSLVITVSGFANKKELFANLNSAITSLSNNESCGCLL